MPIERVSHFNVKNLRWRSVEENVRGFCFVFRFLSLFLYSTPSFSLMRVPIIVRNFFGQ